MTWYREIELTQWLFIAAFLFLYGMYLARIIHIARTLKSPFYSVFIKLVLRTVLFALLMVALLGPSFGSSKKEVKAIGKDIMICVDLSKSMDAFDIQPTRLEKIKFELKRIIDAFNSDRIGIIIFSSEAFTQCPLTFDQHALDLFVETMNTKLVPTGGTDFGPPLRMALSKLEAEQEQRTQAKSKVIILISDGEDFGEETDEMAQEIEEKGIKLFTLGIGTPEGGNIYAENGLKTDRQGKVITTKLNPASLRDLAGKTGGQYFEVNRTRNDVAKLINTISKIEGELREARFVDVSGNKYFYFLMAALVLLLLDLLLSVKTVRI